MGFLLGWGGGDKNVLKLTAVMVVQLMDIQKKTIKLYTSNRGEFYGM